MAEKVLLVDDEKDFLEVMAERMAARGIEVSTASSATEAIRLAEKESFDAIIVDLMMPEMDGFAFLEAVQGHAGIRDIPIVVLTAKDLSRKEKQLLSGRTAQVLAKAETSNVELIDAIRRSLRPSLASESHVAPA